MRQFRLHAQPDGQVFRRHVVVFRLPPLATLAVAAFFAGIGHFAEYRHAAPSAGAVGRMSRSNGATSVPERTRGLEENERATPYPPHTLPAQVEQVKGKVAIKNTVRRCGDTTGRPGDRTMRVVRSCLSLIRLWWRFNSSVTIFRAV